MTKKKTVPKKQLLISPDGQTVAYVILNKVGGIIGWAVRGLGAPLEGGRSNTSGNISLTNTKTDNAKTVSDADANLDY